MNFGQIVVSGICITKERKTRGARYKDDVDDGKGASVDAINSRAKQETNFILNKR